MRKVFVFSMLLLVASPVITSCADKDVRKSKKVQKNRAKKHRTNVGKHKNHKKLAH